MTENVVVQLHRALVDALILSDKHSEHDPVTVAEIYQDLIPYRAVRALGFAMNADYEHALLQLLAGHQGLAQIEPPEVRDALIDELNSPNPNVAIYRNYAACDVLVTMPTDVQPVPPREVKPNPPERSPKPDPVHFDTASGHDADDALNALRTVAQPRPPQAPSLEKKPVVKPPAAAMGACVSCKRSLPAGKPVRFCPFCGSDQKERKCAGCGQKLEEGWKFCIACGTQNA